MPARDRAATVAYLLLLQLLYSWSWSSSDVLRPLFRGLYGLSLAEAGLAYSAQVTGALLGALMTGPIEHRIGRRATLALIGCGCGIALGLGALVASLPQLVAQRLVLGAFMGAVFPVTIGVMVELFPPGQRGRLASLIDATYFGAVIALGWGVALLVPIDWRLMFWPVGALLVLVGLAAFLLRLPVHAVDRPSIPPSARELFAAPHRRRTLALAAMISLNACAHQAFAGWMTVYLTEIARASPAAVAATLSAQYAGSVLGCFAWGYVVDRFGRRAGGRGLFAAGLIVVAFVLMPGPLWAKQAAAFAFGFSFAAVVTIGPWLAELYPPGLRAPATSIFQWGRFVSLFAPPFTGALAAFVGLPAVMALAGIGFVVSSIVWRRLPETHRA